MFKCLPLLMFRHIDAISRRLYLNYHKKFSAALVTAGMVSLTCSTPRLKAPITQNHGIRSLVLD